METPSEVTLTEDIGSAPKGSVYVRGLNSKPKFYKDSNDDDWYWAKGSKKEECHFFHKNVIQTMLNS